MKGIADLRQLFAGPGTDLREWVKNGIVQQVIVDEDRTGVYVDCLVNASKGTDGTLGGWPCRAKYVWDVYVPIVKGDQVSLFFPNGNPNAGAWCFGPHFNEEDLLPEDFDFDAVNVRARPGVNVVVWSDSDVNVTAKGSATVHADGDATLDAGGDAVVSAKGTATIKAQTAILDSLDVRLGGTLATDRLVLWEPLKSYLSGMKMDTSQLINGAGPVGATSGTPVEPPGDECAATTSKAL